MTVADELRAKATRAHRRAQRSIRRHKARRKAFFATLNKPERVEARRENIGLTAPAPIILDGCRQP